MKLAPKAFLQRKGKIGELGLQSGLVYLHVAKFDFVARSFHHVSMSASNLIFIILATF